MAFVDMKITWFQSPSMSYYYYSIHKSLISLPSGPNCCNRLGISYKQASFPLAVDLQGNLQPLQERTSYGILNFLVDLEQR